MAIAMIITPSNNSTMIYPLIMIKLMLMMIMIMVIQITVIPDNNDDTNAKKLAKVPSLDMEDV